MTEFTPMKPWSFFPQTLREPRSTLSDFNSRVEVCPPSLRHAPTGSWQRLKFWLLAPAAGDVAPPLSRLPAVRDDFLAALGDVHTLEADRLVPKIHAARSLRELWHLRSAVYGAVSLSHSQFEAERRVAALNRHFATRAPRQGAGALRA